MASAGLLKNAKVEADLELVKAALKRYGVDIPSRATAKKIVELLRAEYKKRCAGVDEDDWIRCEVCEEITDPDPDLYRCPFCGDEGVEDEGEAADVEAVTDEQATNALEEEDDVGQPPEESVTLTKYEPQAMPAPPNVNEITLSEQGLQRATVEALACKRDIAARGYDLGLVLLRVFDIEAWKAGNFRTFKVFCEEGLEIPQSSVYRMMDIARKFTRDDFVRLGIKKLAILASVPEKDREEAVADAKRTNPTARELAEKVRDVNDPEPPPEIIDVTPEPTQEESIRLVAKVGGRARSYKFQNDEGKILTQFEDGAHAQVQVTDAVSIVAVPKFSKDGALTGLSVKFVQHED